MTLQLGLYQFIYADQTRFGFGEKELGVLTVLLWCTVACAMSQFSLSRPQINSEGERGPSERQALIQG